MYLVPVERRAPKTRAEIPASRRNATTTETRLLVRVLQDVIRSETFTSYADLAESFKVQCARLRIRYDATGISAAIDRLERGGVAPVVARRAPRPRPRVDRTPDPISRVDAFALLAEICASARARRGGR